MTTEHEIDALLKRDDTLSIIDRLMALPRPSVRTSDEWDRAVASRFETHLAERMRAAIGIDQRRDAA